MIEVVSIDGAKVTLYGDYAVTVLDTRDDGRSTAALLEARLDVDAVQLTGARPTSVIVCAQRFLSDAEIAALAMVTRARRLAPVLPVRSRRGLTVPFLHAGEMVQQADPASRKLSDFALEYECARGAIAADEVFAQMRRILEVVRGGVRIGLAGTEYADRILPRQSHRFAAMLEHKQLLDGGLLNRAMLYVTALMEVKSSMGVFVAADFHGTIVNDVTVPNPANPQQQLYTGMFEIITGSVAYSAPAGPTFAQLGVSTGVLNAQQYAYYLTLPPAAQDVFVQNVLDGVVSQYGYSVTGIQDPSIAASFTVGGPVAVHHYGWTEFEVNAQSKALTMTTWGVDWYTPQEAAADPDAIIARPLTVRQRFTVQSHLTPCPADRDGNRRVDGADLAVVLAAWGELGSSQDLTGDGVVDGPDLAFLLAAWGSCPQ
jgi:hypothetical protein